MTIVMWFSRYREYRADAGGAKLAGRNNMIAALQQLQRQQGTPALPDEMAAFAINAGKVQKLFSSHPPLEDRIRALRQS
jgi:heat shock protein HtpX